MRKILRTDCQIEGGRRLSPIWQSKELFNYIASKKTHERGKYSGIMCEPSNWRKQQFDSSDNSCNLIGQYSLLLFILTFDWLMESIETFPKLDGFFKAEVNVPAKTIQFILNLDNWQKSIKNRTVCIIGF